MTRSTRDRIAHVFSRNPWFARQTPALRTRIFELAQVSSVEAGHWVYDAGDEARGLYGVLEGSVRILAWLERSGYRLANISGEGEIFGYAGRSVRGRRQLTAVTREPSQLVYVPEHALATLAHEFPDFWQSFAELATNQLQLVVHVLVETLNLPPDALIASRLAQLASLPRVRAAGDGIAIHLTQQETGELTGLSRKTVNQVLNRLEEGGYITRRYGEILVHDIAGLFAIVESDDEQARAD